MDIMPIMEKGNGKIKNKKKEEHFILNAPPSFGVSFPVIFPIVS